MQIPFYSTESPHQALRDTLMGQLAAVLDSNRYVLGSQVAAFEREYAQLCATPHAVGVSNGFDALHLSLRALDIGPGHEVIVPAHCFMACVLAVVHAGATPVLADADPSTCNLDPAAVEAAVTPRTRAVMAVHLYGQPCPLDVLVRLAERHGLYLLEDSAQAHGALFAGRPVGGWGHIHATSFYPTKNLGALGDAGAVTTPDAALADRVRKLRNYGSGEKYYYELAGFNARLDELQAAVLRAKLPHLAAWNQRRRHLAALYHTQLAGIAGLHLPAVLPQADPVWHLYVVRTAARNALQAHLQRHGIGTLIHYPVPPHLQQAGRAWGYGPGAFPVAEQIAATCLSLPLYPGLTDGEADLVAEKVRDFFA